MKFLAKIFDKQFGDIITGANHVLDKVVTNDKERSLAKAELSSIVFNSLQNLYEYQRDLIQAEMQGNWLQRSWRPIVMLTFTAMIVIGAFVSIPYLETASPFWKVLELGLGGYIIGRSVEKTAETVTKNIDIPFIKKRDRKINQNEDGSKG